MSDHPSTLGSKDDDCTGIAWDDRASLHRVEDGGGVLSAAKNLRTGTFAELIAQVMAFPEEKRGEYYILKDGDRQYRIEEIQRLVRRDDFPHES